MIPQANQQVKCILKNGALVEGFVQEWSDQEVILRSLDGESILIVTHPREDIVLIRILLEIPENIEQPAKVKTELEEQFQQAYEEPSGDDLRTKRLAELKVLLLKQEKKIVAEKLKDHNLSQSPGLTQYHYPGGMGNLPTPQARITHGHTRFGKKPSSQ
jgi:hypothetical protein